MHRLQIYVPNIKSMSGLQFYAYNISTISRTLTLGVVYRSMLFTHVFANLCLDIAHLCWTLFGIKCGGWGVGRGCVLLERVQSVMWEKRKETVFLVFIQFKIKDKIIGNLQYVIWYLKLARRSTAKKVYRKYYARKRIDCFKAK